MMGDVATDPDASDIHREPSGGIVFEGIRQKHHAIIFIDLLGLYPAEGCAAVASGHAHSPPKSTQGGYGSMNGPRLREAAASVTHLTALSPPPVMPSPLQSSSASRRTAGAAFVGGDDVTVSAPASLRTRSRGRRFTREGPSQNLVLPLMALI